MSLRILLAVFAGLLGGLWGQRYAGRIRADALRLRRWLVLLERLQLLVKQGTLPLPAVFCEAADSNSVPDRLLQVLAEKMHHDPLCPLLDCYDSLPSEALERATLRPLMAQLDRGSIESRVLAVGQARDAILRLSEAATSRADRDGAMWTRLGWTGGACLTLLLL